MWLDVSGYIWIYLDISGYIWIYLDISGHIRAYQLNQGANMDRMIQWNIGKIQVFPDPQFTISVNLPSYNIVFASKYQSFELLFEDH